MTKLTAAVLCAAVFLSAPLSARPLVLAVGGEPDGGFDPLTGWGRYGNPLFQSTLLKRDADLTLEGDLATDWGLSEDGLIWSVTLREDARFSDGAPVTAEDVAFTFNTARDAGGLVDLQDFVAARATGPFTVDLELSAPRISFASRLATLGIVPAKSYGPGYAREPIGSGPFRMVEWQEGAQLVVEPNPYWHGGEVPFERVSFVFGSEDAGLALARTGVADVVAVPASQADAPPEGMRALHIETVDNRGLMFPMRPDTGERSAGGAPIGNDVTADRAIRVAVNQALDRDALVALALGGHGRPATGPADGLPWDNPDAGLAGNDPDAARATLEAAGWVDADGDGTREKDGLPARFAIVYPSSDSTRQALALGAAQQLRGIGITAEPAGRSWDEIGAMMHSNVVVFGWGAHDPSEVYNLYHGRFAAIDDFNPGYYDNPAVNAHLEAAESANDFAASLPHWRAAAWDGETGFGPRGDAAWAWMVNLEHSYWVSECLDMGPMQIHPHGHGFPITHDLPGWRWTCAE
ncbi:peptide/nickel transport system substrate-binding protein [Palleronia aestuarii]|uniref:Peptide/nickel transport system substrate-binding protein n=1 Tax=Palleronia aestuarii TaxID=568105 RepID=A0A2W7NA50_9RHOB|nr:ABC transporter substrate-binding protein [Palleronia aestuarii]PZX13734.1 peptide/nickel transport system substrate-binding protein [Palleronia aestuarii]